MKTYNELLLSCVLHSTAAFSFHSSGSFRARPRTTCFSFNDRHSPSQDYPPPFRPPNYGNSYNSPDKEFDNSGARFKNRDSSHDRSNDNGEYSNDMDKQNSRPDQMDVDQSQERRPRSNVSQSDGPNTDYVRAPPRFNNDSPQRQNQQSRRPRFDKRLTRNIEARVNNVERRQDTARGRGPPVDQYRPTQDPSKRFDNVQKRLNNVEKGNDFPQQRHRDPYSQNNSASKPYNHPTDKRGSRSEERSRDENTVSRRNEPPKGYDNVENRRHNNMPRERPMQDYPPQGQRDYIDPYPQFDNGGDDLRNDARGFDQSYSFESRKDDLKKQDTSPQNRDYGQRQSDDYSQERRNVDNDFNSKMDVNGFENDFPSRLGDLEKLEDFAQHDSPNPYKRNSNDYESPRQRTSSNDETYLRSSGSREDPDYVRNLEARVVEMEKLLNSLLGQSGQPPL